jgi:hypothetical protein
MAADDTLLPAIALLLSEKQDDGRSEADAYLADDNI